MYFVSETAQVEPKVYQCKTLPRGPRAGPRWRVHDTKHSNRDRIMPYLQGECSCRRADEEEEEEE